MRSLQEMLSGFLTRAILWFSIGWKVACFGVQPMEAVSILQASLQTLCYILLIMVARAKMIYFVHDHAAHDTEGFKRKISVAVINTLARLSNARVVHDPSYEKTYGATYLPHPLYWDTGNVKIEGLTAVNHPTTPSLKPRFGILGMIRAYKGIDKILAVWPVGTKLMIRGEGKADYCAELTDIIEQRQLAQDVVLHPGFMLADEFDAALSNIDILMLPHLSGTMLVSGAFLKA